MICTSENFIRHIQSRQLALVHIFIRRQQDVRPINYNPLSPYFQSILLLRLILKQLDDLKVNSAVRNFYGTNILEKAWHLVRNYYAIISVNRKIILITVTKLNDYLWSRLVMTLCVAEVLGYSTRKPCCRRESARCRCNFRSIDQEHDK